MGRHFTAEEGKRGRDNVSPDKRRKRASKAAIVRWARVKAGNVFEHHLASLTISAHCLELALDGVETPEVRRHIEAIHTFTVKMMGLKQFTTIEMERQATPALTHQGSLDVTEMDDKQLEEMAKHPHSKGERLGGPLSGYWKQLKDEKIAREKAAANPDGPPRSVTDEEDGVER